MKLHEHSGAGINLIARYGAGGVEIKGRTLRHPLIVAPGALVSDWITDASELTPLALTQLWPLEARIVLLGGSPFPPDTLRALRRALAEREMALEAMDLGAACRTYNVLAQEEREVAALLFPG